VVASTGMSRAVSSVPVEHQPPPLQVHPGDRQAVPPWEYALLSTVPLTWGFNFIALHVLSRTFSVMGLLAGRYVLMVLALFAALWIFERDVRISRKHLPYMIVFSVVTVVIYQPAFTAGVYYTMAAEAALLISTAPIFAMLIAWVIRWEDLTVKQGIGTLVGFAGIACVIIGGMKSYLEPREHNFGLAVMVASAILWACYAVFSKPLLRVYSPLKVNFWAHLLGSVVLIPLGLKDALAVDWAQLSVETWVYFFYFALLAGVYGFVIWFRGVSKIGSSKTMLFQYCVPLVATVVAYFLMHQVPTPLQGIGIFVTLVGLQLAVPGRKPAPRPAAET